MVDILRCDGRQTQGHQCVPEVINVVVGVGGEQRSAWARGLEAYGRSSAGFTTMVALFKKVMEASSNQRREPWA